MLSLIRLAHVAPLQDGLRNCAHHTVHVPEATRRKAGRVDIHLSSRQSFIERENKL